jgi:hypothetical protein
VGDGTEFDDTFLALPGFKVPAVTDDGAELLVGMETIRQAAGCPVCGVIARTKDRLRVVIRDLPVFNRHVRLSGGMLNQRGARGRAGALQGRP